MSVPPRSTALVMDETRAETFGVVMHLFHQHFRIGDNDSQNIVEVVGDAACKSPDGFHFLHMAEPLFDATDMGNVFGDHLKIEHCPGVILYRAAADFHR